ncbi:hypothetical protein PILCRDRAFT_822244 [Piloderma croceum F 1598]|uniref:Uncharacterized protein n=1 Tax=Piloderma croceum (strain F 1598) TaxID=765440 RepID=A0A0C3FLW0_PILCF|nr:hypothetical protein PILCRDRAFT_822244 [Piloderma croceum F 1598]
MKTWTEEAGDVSAKLDHISPRSWRGDVTVKNVVLLTCWSEGRRTASSQLLHAGWTAPFDEMEKIGGFDMFCPLGENRMVLMDGLTEGERNEDDEETDIRPPELDGPSDHQPIPSDIDVSYEPDLEDMAAEELTPLEPSHAKHEAYLIVDGETGGTISQHKSSILRIFSDNDANSTDRLKRVRDLSRFNESGKGLGLGNLSDPEEPKINIEDPAATLVRSKHLIWLAIVQIVDIRLDHIGIQSLPTRLLGQPNVQIRVQVMRLAPVRLGEENDYGDWEWTGRFEHLDTKAWIGYKKI